MSLQRREAVTSFETPRREAVVAENIHDFGESLVAGSAFTHMPAPPEKLSVIQTAFQELSDYEVREYLPLFATWAKHRNENPESVAQKLSAARLERIKALALETERIRAVTVDDVESETDVEEAPAIDHLRELLVIEKSIQIFSAIEDLVRACEKSMRGYARVETPGWRGDLFQLPIPTKDWHVDYAEKRKKRIVVSITVLGESVEGALNYESQTEPGEVTTPPPCSLAGFPGGAHGTHHRSPKEKGRRASFIAVFEEIQQEYPDTKDIFARAQ